MPKAIVAAQLFSSSAGSRVISPVGFSSASSYTLRERSNVLQIWLIAAPPAWKFATIACVTDAGKAETPCATTP